MNVNWQPEFRLLWPTPAQTALLEAALLAPPLARRAFDRWRELAGLKRYDEIDYPTSRLLPRVVANLGAADLPQDWLTSMRGLHRYHWVRAARRQAELFAIVAKLNARGITPVLLKGEALAAGRYFADIGQRPMGDSDLLVEPHAAPQAVEVLRAHGLEAAPPPRPAFPFSHDEAWRRQGIDVVDLHRKMLPPPFGPVFAHELAARGEQVERHGVRFVVPAPTDLLLHLCAHGRFTPGGEEPTPFLWVADVYRVLDLRGRKIDWNALWQRARKCRALFPVREALGYVAAHFPVEIPAEALRQARETPLLREELRPFFRWILPRNRYPSLLELVEHAWDDYACVAESSGQEISRTGYTAYVSKAIGAATLHKGASLKYAARIVGRFVTEGRAAVNRPPLFEHAERLITRSLRPAA